MNENDQQHDSPGDREDLDLRESLAHRSFGTSENHDSAVMLAAQDAANEIRQRMSATTRTRWQRWTRPMAIAAALMLGIYLLIDTNTQPSVDADLTMRGASAAEVAPPHRASVDKPPEQFSWPVQIGASGYRVTLRDSDATPIWNSDIVNRNEIAVPNNIRTQLDGGATYLWTVEIEGPGEREMLGPFWFQVAD